MKRQRRREGDIHRIDLGDGTHVYAREGKFSVSAFYDARVTEELPIDEIVKLPILFHLSVMDVAIKQGRWKIVGNRSLDEAPLPDPPPQFIQDAIHKKHFRITFRNGTIRNATREEIEGLERCAIWFPEHVEGRLLDHYEGRTNWVVEGLKLRD